MKQIQIPLKITQKILEHAQSQPDVEVCGLIGSVDDKPVNCYPVINTDPQPQTKFTLDATEQIGTFKSMREKGEQLFAIYHSHPNNPAIPSMTDLTLANYPDVLYLIISLNTKGILELRGFYIKDNNAQEVALTLYS